MKRLNYLIFSSIGFITGSYLSGNQTGIIDTAMPMIIASIICFFFMPNKEPKQ